MINKYIRWCTIGVLLLIFTQLICGIIFSLLHIDIVNNDINKTGELLNNISAMFITFLAAPVIEEFIFRYLLFRKDAEYPINIVTAIISSFVFGLVHGKDMILTIPLIINGLIYCLVYHKSNSIFVSIITHSIFNIFIFTILLINTR